jgi:hypothetical protein
VASKGILHEGGLLALRVVLADSELAEAVDPERVEQPALVRWQNVRNMRMYRPW